jgi:hypothetical protein
MAAVAAFTAAASVEAAAFAAAGFMVAFVAAAFAAVGSTIAASTIGSSSLAILATRSFTIPIHTTGTIPTAIILMVTDTVALAAASVAVAFVAVGDSYNEPVYQGSAGYTDDEKSIHECVFQKLGNKNGGAPVVLNECNRA